MSNSTNPQYWAGTIADAVCEGWRLASNPWGMYLDDMLAACTGGQHRHPSAPNEKQMAWLRRVTELTGQAFAALPPFTDILGPVYMEVSGRGHKSAMGQYFSPPAIARVMAELSLHDMADSLQAKARAGELVTVYEPAAGSGVMMLAALEKAYTEHPALTRYLSLTVNDLDISCVKMCAIQLAAQSLIHQVPVGHVHITWGNALLGGERGPKSFVSWGCWPRHQVTPWRRGTDATTAKVAALPMAANE